MAAAGPAPGVPHRAMTRWETTTPGSAGRHPRSGVPHRAMTRWGTPARSLPCGPRRPPSRWRTPPPSAPGRPGGGGRPRHGCGRWPSPAGWRARWAPRWRWSPWSPRAPAATWRAPSGWCPTWPATRARDSSPWPGSACASPPPRPPRWSAGGGGRRRRSSPQASPRWPPRRWPATPGPLRTGGWPSEPTSPIWPGSPCGSGDCWPCWWPWGRRPTGSGSPPGSRPWPSPRCRWWS